MRERERAYRPWSVTFNNYTDKNILEFKKLLKDKNQLVYGLEVGSNGTPHIQGAIIIHNKITFTTLKKKLPGWHIEIKYKKSTLKQLFSYCLKGSSETKDGWTYDHTGPDYVGWHYGEFPTNQGERTDIDDIKECTTMKEAFNTGHNLQCVQYYEKYLKYFEEPRRLKPMCYWYFGPTGCSKTWLAKKIAKNWGKVYHKTNKSKWWDGYDGEQVIILDDYNKNWDIDFNELLHVCQGGEHRIETKGGTRQLKGLRIFITSSKCVADTFQNVDVGGELDQLEDRVHEFAFSKKYGHKKKELGNIILGSVC